MKTITLNILVMGLVSSVLGSSIAHANSIVPSYVQKCLPTGISKLQFQADALDAKLDIENVRVCGIDNRFLNPSKYVWYCADATSNDGEVKEISTLVQYSFYQCN